MKTRFHILVAAGLIVAFQTQAMAQSHVATATASATVVSPIKLLWAQQLDFGTVVPSASAGTLLMDVSGLTVTSANWHSLTHPPTASGGTSWIQQGDAGEGPATFDAIGTPGFNFSITLPASIPVLYITLNGQPSPPNPEMSLSNFTTNIVGNGHLNNITGNAYFAVGATLHVNANQPPGMYTGSFTVSVNYN
jgi:hypothetical protein